MDIENIIAYILAHPKDYQGLHVSPQPRTSSEFKPLEPGSQMQLIWKATIEYVHENLLQGKGVNIQGFGAFTFDIATELPKIASINPMDPAINEQRLQRKHLHKNRPVFIPDPGLEYLLQRYHRKSQIDKPASQKSVYQKGFQMIFCNPVPIAQACYLGKSVIRDFHKALFKAIKELTKLGRIIHIPFNFCVVIINNMSLSVQFTNDFTRSVNTNHYEFKMRKSDDPCNKFWKTTSEDKWRSSVLSKLWGRPNSQIVQKMNEKTLALKILSLDLASTMKVRN
jgi:CCDC81 eukaryotic HU domain 1/CCDC81 eukaryotic HU domain 2